MPEPHAARLPRDVLTASGPEATPYLQGQLSQDVAAIPVGGHGWSWLLAPNGKVDALVRLTHRGDQDWVIDTDAGWGDAVVTRLNRFRLRTKVEVAPAPDASVVGLRGKGWESVDAGEALVLSPPWPGVEGADLIALSPAALSLDETQPDPAGYEAARVEAGIPRMGAELDERTIPAETGLIDLTVSFTKGCYTGQELVARIDSRGGNVPRRLRRLALDGTVEAGVELLDPDGKPAGVITSVAAPAGGGWIGLGYIKRAVDPSTPLTAGPGGPVVRIGDAVG